MAGKSTKFESLRKRLPEYIDAKRRKVAYGRECYEKDRTDWNFLAGELWDLGQLLLADNNIEEARKCFAEGTKLTLGDDGMREDLAPLRAADYETPLMAYLGDSSAGKLYSSTPKISPGDLDDYIRLYKAWYYGLYGLIRSDDGYVRTICDLMAEKTSGFELGPDGMPPSVTHKRLAMSYAVYCLRMVRAVIEKDSETFSNNMNFRSTLKARAVTRADNPFALVDVGLVVLYDVALGRGLEPKVETQFIPEGILENGYWHVPKWNAGGKDLSE